MSAIAGIVRFDGPPLARAEIERMTTRLAHRGPDGRNSVAFDGVGLGHCLSRVTVEDDHDAQPIHDPVAGLTLVADVRLDNRAVLAGALAITDSDLATMADGDLLLAAYRHWGSACVEHLLGDFVFAVWDARRALLFLARDPMGQCGVYYHHGAGLFTFASEIKALWTVDGVPRRLSETAIGRRLLFPIDSAGGATLYEGISILPGGTTLVLDAAGALTLDRYWVPHAAAEHLGRDEAYYRVTYRALVEEAVACRVRRLARPPALLFSGGFDSGTIAAVAGPIAAARGGRLIAVASVLPPGEHRAVRDARAAVEAFRGYPYIDIHYHVRGEANRFTAIERSFDVTDDWAGHAYVRDGVFACAAATGARLVMDGHGGDYTVNVRAPAMLGRILRGGHLRRFVREFGARRRVTGRSRLDVVRSDVLQALLPLTLIAAWYALGRGFVPLWRTRAIRDDFARSLFEAGAIDRSRLRQSSLVHHRWRTRWLHLLDKITMMGPAQPTLAAAHGLTFTRPFHDRRIVEFALAIPESLQFRDGLERPLARYAFADRLPPRLLASGPGNDAEDPDFFRASRESAAIGLAAVRAHDHGHPSSRYIDFEKVDAMIADVDESRFADHRRLHIGVTALVLARFVAWFDSNNA